MRIRVSDLLRGEKAAPKSRFYSQNIEVIAGNIEAPDALVDAIVTETGDDKTISEQTGEDRVAIAIILVVRIRLEREIGAVAQLAVDRDQLRRLAHRQRPQQDRIDQAKDGGVGANPERHGENGERGKAGMFQQLSPAKTNVLQSAPTALRCAVAMIGFNF